MELTAREVYDTLDGLVGVAVDPVDATVGRVLIEDDPGIGSGRRRSENYLRVTVEEERRVGSREIESGAGPVDFRIGLELKQAVLDDIYTLHEMCDCVAVDDDPATVDTR